MLTRVVFFKSLVKIDDDREIYDTRLNLESFRRIVQFATDSWSRTEPLKARVYRLEGDLTYETDGKAYQNIFHETLDNIIGDNFNGGNSIDVGDTPNSTDVGQNSSLNSTDVGQNSSLNLTDSPDSPDSPDPDHVAVMNLIRHKRPFQSLPCTKDSILSVHDVIRVVYVVDEHNELVLEMIRPLPINANVRVEEGGVEVKIGEGEGDVIFRAFLNFDSSLTFRVGENKVVSEIYSLISCLMLNI